MLLLSLISDKGRNKVSDEEKLATVFLGSYVIAIFM